MYKLCILNFKENNYYKDVNNVLDSIISKWN